MSEFTADQPKVPTGLPVVSLETIEAIEANSSENLNPVEALRTLQPDQPVLFDAIFELIQKNTRNRRDVGAMAGSISAVYHMLKQQAAANAVQAQLEPTDHLATSLPIVSSEAAALADERSDKILPADALEDMKPLQPHLANAIANLAKTHADDAFQENLIIAAGVYTFWLLDIEATKQFEQQYMPPNEEL